jgi:hypothetical protein
VNDPNSTFIRVEEVNCAGGDSGGPWFFGNLAYGTHSGGNELGGTCIFMAINYLNGIDVDPLISP